MSTTPPVLLLIFNRPEPTRRTLERILAARPTRLYVAADGPRPHHPMDRAQCEATRATIAELAGNSVTATHYRQHNLGCRRAVADALRWFFEQEEEGIVLEDDCRPEPAFFSYCRWGLDTFRDRKKVWHLSGMGFSGSPNTSMELRFTRLPFIWGWATWRDRWIHYSDEITLSDTELRVLVERVISSRHGRRYWFEKFAAVRDGLINTWDYQWMLTLWQNGGYALTPNTSYVTNIGFDASATHTTMDMSGTYAPLWEGDLIIDFPMQHLDFDAETEVRILEQVFGIESRDWIDRWNTLWQHPTIRWWQLGIGRRLRNLWSHLY